MASAASKTLYCAPLDASVRSSIISGIEKDLYIHITNILYSIYTYSFFNELTSS